MKRFPEPGIIRRPGLLVPLLVAMALFLVSCSKVPFTGRSRFLLVDEATELQMGVTGYEQVLEESNLSEDEDLVRRVRTIGERIAEVTDRDDFDWEFNVIEADSIANAFCLPGGKVAVYTGIIDLAGSDDELATVMAHEIAHAIARHGAERMTQMLMVDLGGMALSEALSAKTETTLQLASIAYGVGTGLLYVLPYSRTHESEADYMGLMYMAKAGYDPRAAVDFWVKMQEQGGAAPPEFLSTHPNPETRIEDLKKWMPEALNYYEKAR
ncbi:MAG: M48 family metallopeptidase [bacterium]|jgi:predicted Zn-dependent protease